MQMAPDGTLLLNRSEIRELLTLEESISAVERAYRAHAEGNTLAAGLLHVDAHGGEFHVKAGGLKAARTYFALKANGGFFENQKRYGLPNIQGVILLCDGENGYPLALMDSTEITIQRTGAATAVAAKYLARPDSRVATICGCGTQGRIQLKALLHALPIRKVWAFDQQPEAARTFSSDMTASLGIDVQPTADLKSAVQQSDVCIACTPSRKHFLMKEMVGPGTFISAIGADSPDKQELEPELLVGNKVVADILDQCVNVGELHHAIGKGLLHRDDVYAEIGEIIAGRKPGRTSPEEITIFDATGTALQDTAAAIVVYEKAAGKSNHHRFAFAG